MINRILTRQISVCVWKILSGWHIGFQVVSIIYGKQALADKLVASLILVLHSICFGMRLESELDDTPIENMNRLSLKQGKFC